MTSLRDLIRAYRACTSRYEERALVKKEAAHIRDLFREGDKHFRRQNIAKLLFFHMNGYPTDFGVNECIKLCASSKFADKRIAYLGMTILVDETDQVLMLITNSLKQDLNNADINIVSLALNVMADIASAEMLRELMPEVETLLKSPNPHIRKKAGLAAVRAVRKLSSEETINVLELCTSYFDTRSSAVHVSGAALVEALCMQVETNASELHDSALPFILSILSEHASGAGPQRPADLYGSMHESGNPFLVCKLLGAVRALLSYAPPSDAMVDRVCDVLTALADRFNGSKVINCAVLYEIVRLSVHLQGKTTIRALTTEILSRFLSHREATVRYIALQELNALADVDGAKALQPVKELSERLLVGLRETDSTVRKQAVELVFRTTTSSNVDQMVNEVAEYVKKSTDPLAVRDGCEKLFLMADEYGMSDQRKVDIFSETLKIGHRHISDALISCLIAFVSAHPSVQPHAVRVLFDSILREHTEWYRNDGHNLVRARPQTVATQTQSIEAPQRRPRAEATALHIIGEHSSAASTIHADAIIRACEILLIQRDDLFIDGDEPQREDFDAASHAALTALLKVAARTSNTNKTEINNEIDILSDLASSKPLALQAPPVFPAADDEFGLQLIVHGESSERNSPQDIGLEALSALDLDNTSGSAGRDAPLKDALSIYDADVKSKSSPVEETVKGMARSIFEKLTSTHSVEQQQRACEYLSLLDASSASILSQVVSPIPSMKYSGVRSVLELAGPRRRPQSSEIAGNRVATGGELLLDLIDEEPVVKPAAITAGDVSLEDDPLAALDALAFSADLSNAAVTSGSDDLLALTMGNETGIGSELNTNGTSKDAVRANKASISPIHTPISENLLSDSLRQNEPTILGVEDTSTAHAEGSETTIVAESDHLRLTTTLNHPKSFESEWHTTALMTITNISTSTFSNCVLELAVPKYIGLKMDSASRSDAAPGESIQQTILLMNRAHGTKPIQFRYRIEFRMDGDAEVNRVEGLANNLPQF